MDTASAPPLKKFVAPVGEQPLELLDVSFIPIPNYSYRRMDVDDATEQRKEG
jgi:hypothetical protein